MFTWAEDDPSSAVEAHPIDKQHDYDLLLVTTEVSQGYSSAQRWRLRLGTSGIVKCETKKVDWPSAEEQVNRKAMKSLRNRFRRR